MCGGIMCIICMDVYTLAILFYVVQTLTNLAYTIHININLEEQAL